MAALGSKYLSAKENTETNKDENLCFSFLILDADPDQSFHSNADQDPTYHLNADPDRILIKVNANLRPLVYRPSTVLLHSEPLLLRCERPRPFVALLGAS
jgi:hypothetical protein